MTDDELLRAILANPDADPPRRSYAALLRARGDSRGELIEVQLDLAARSDDDPAWPPLRRRELALLAARSARWLGRLGDGVVGRLHRGFIDRLAGDWQPVLDGLEAVAGREPVTELVLRTRGHHPAAEAIDALARSPDAATVTRLTVALTTETAARLLATPLAARLDALDVMAGVFSDAGLTTLVGADLARLARLRIPIPDGARGASLLLGALRLPALRALSLDQSGQDDEAVAILAAGLPPLDELALRSNPRLGPRAAAALAAAPALASLRTLDLRQTAIGTAGTAALAAGLPALEELRVGTARVDVAALAAAPWPRLRRLDGSYDPAALRTLGAAPWSALRSFQPGGALEVEGAAALAGGPAYRGLTTLELGGDRLDDAAVGALTAGAWPSLHTLDLRGSPRLGAAAARALLAGALPSLTDLDVRGTGIPAAAVDELRARFGAGVLADG